MNTLIKEFIEYNIDIIEKQQWDELFKNWYMFNKDYYFDDMMEVLETAYDNIWNITYEARARILQEIAVNVFTNLSFKSRIITFEYIGGELSSLMGFEGQDLINILDVSARKVGLTRSTNGWYRV